jgi:hypothetical protein
VRGKVTNHYWKSVCLENSASVLELKFTKKLAGLGAVLPVIPTSLRRISEAPCHSRQAIKAPLSARCLKTQEALDLPDYHR